MPQIEKWMNLIAGMSSSDFLRTGYYHRSNGYIYGRVANGYWWSFAAGSDVYGHYLITYPTGVLPQDNDYRGGGFAVRCVVREG